MPDGDHPSTIWGAEKGSGGIVGEKSQFSVDIEASGPAAESLRVSIDSARSESRLAARRQNQRFAVASKCLPSFAHLRRHSECAAWATTFRRWDVASEQLPVLAMDNQSFVADLIRWMLGIPADQVTWRHVVFDRRRLDLVWPRCVPTMAPSQAHPVYSGCHA